MQTLASTMLAPTMFPSTLPSTRKIGLNTLNQAGPPFDHLQSCRLHDDTTPQVCFGILRKRGTFQCMKKAAFCQPQMMPTCRLHQEQLKRAADCKVPLACGLECGRLCEWTPHSFQRCAAHVDHQMPCYFLKIPLELRTRIYDMLLPDQDMPAHWQAGIIIPTSLAILRVNRQIHDEATSLMYSANTFTIQLSEHGLLMCNSRSQPPQMTFGPMCGRPGPGNHALQDYQMQLMLLEQQNRRRRAMARQEQAQMAQGVHGSMHTVPPLPPLNSRFAGPSNNPYPWLQTPSSLEPVWNAPLSSKYFDLIQRFRIQICFLGPAGSTMPGVHYPYYDADDAQFEQAQTQRLYEFSDHFHKLVNRLQLTGRRINRLEVDFEFGQAYSNIDEACAAVELLLRPSRRLCEVGSAKVRSITATSLKNHQNTTLDILNPPWGRNDNLAEYVQIWSRDLSAPTPSLPPTAVFEGYWKLETLFTQIKTHCDHLSMQTNPELSSEFQHFAELRQKARIAREDDDLSSFKEIFETVIQTWQRYLDWEKEFQVNTWKEIEGIWDVVAEGEKVGV